MDDTIQISFLITHFNRPLDLAVCLKGIRDISISNYEIVVSDDGSTIENIEVIKSYDVEQLILAKSNQGLAANINKGLRACKGKYIVYCQEDFILAPDIDTILPECFELLESEKVDMIRFTSNVNFKKTVPLTQFISRIPKFSFQNFTSSPYQYSDHPFIVKKEFYNKYGYYLENTSGDYGETEYAIRMLKSNAKIAIISKIYLSQVIGSKSVIDRLQNGSNRFLFSKKVFKILRAFRLYLELLLYNKSKRGLRTYRNLRRNE